MPIKEQVPGSPHKAKHTVQALKGGSIMTQDPDCILLRANLLGAPHGCGYAVQAVCGMQRPVSLQ